MYRFWIDSNFSGTPDSQNISCISLFSLVFYTCIHFFLSLFWLLSHSVTPPNWALYSGTPCLCNFCVCVANFGVRALYLEAPYGPEITVMCSCYPCCYCWRKYVPASAMLLGSVFESLCFSVLGANEPDRRFPEHHLHRWRVHSPHLPDGEQHGLGQGLVSVLQGDVTSLTIWRMKSSPCVFKRCQRQGTWCVCVCMYVSTSVRAYVCVCMSECVCARARVCVPAWSVRRSHSCCLARLSVRWKKRGASSIADYPLANTQVGLVSSKHLVLGERKEVPVA